MTDIVKDLRAWQASIRLQHPRYALVGQSADEIERLQAVILNIQALAEQGFPIDAGRLAIRCRRALEPATLTSGERHD